MSQTKKEQHPIMEVIRRSEKTASKVDQRLGQVDLGNRAIRVVAGTHAFRDYNWLSEVVGTNAAGNLRGMVVSAKWRVAFRYFSEESKYMKYMENIGLLAGFAAGIAEALHEVDRTAGSGEPATLKGLRLAAIAGTAAQRALLGAVPAGTHLIYKSLQGWCMLAGLAGGTIESGADQCIATLKDADTLVQSTFKTVTDTGNQSKAAWLVIDTILAPRSGK